MRRRTHDKQLTAWISRLENGEPLTGKVYARTGRARVIGITGPPGVGKSSLIDRLIESLRREQQTVGVVVVDPSSPLSGGALLGDRVRMQRHSTDEGVFIRSLAARNRHGGLANAVQPIVHALDATGFDVILVETVGTGQNEVEIADVADTVVLVLMPEMGDQVQRSKAGLTEVADILVINKTDLLSVAEQPATIDRCRDGKDWQRPTLYVSAKNGTGITILSKILARHQQHLWETGELERRRARAARAEVSRLLLGRLGEAARRTLESPEARKLLLEVAHRRLDPHLAVRKLANRIGR